MTKDQFIALIEANFNTGQLNFITGNKVYNALYQFCDMVFGSSGTGRYRGVCTVNTNPGTSQYGDFFFASYNATNQQVYSNFGLTVQIGEMCVFRYTTAWSKTVIGTITGTGGTGTMTASEIRDALQTLSGADKLLKSAILHGEGALNYLGEDNFSSMAYSGSIYKGDFFRHSGTSGNFVNGDWAIALADGIDVDEIYTSSSWLVLPMGKWMAAFSADQDGNLTFEKNIIVKGQAYSPETTVTIIPTDAIYEEYTPNFDSGNTFRISSNKNLQIFNPLNKKNGSTFVITIRATAAIEIIFDTDFVDLSSISLQNNQTVIISGIISGGQVLCDQSKIFGSTSVPDPPILESIVINNSDTETSDRNVTITPTFNGGGVPSKYAVKEEGGTFGSWQNYSGIITYEIQSQYEGTKTLYMKFANSLNEESEIKNGSILLVENEPSLSGISINNGSSSTSVRNVMVYLQGISGLGTKQIRLSNDGSNWGVWVALSNPVNHTLTESNGEKTVHLQIKNIAGTQANTYTDTINLSTLGVPDLQSIQINEGDTETAAREISIAVTLGSGTTPSHYAIQENGGTFGAWQEYSSSPLTHEILHSGDGAKTIGLKMKDESDNESSVQSANILLVTEAPTLGSISINNNEASTTSKNVLITFQNVTGLGQKEVAVSESELSLSTWTPHNINGAFQFTLSTGNGLKNVYAKVKNIAGESAVSSDAINLNEPTSVVLSAFSLNGGVSPTSNQNVSISFTASGSPDKYMISESATFVGASWLTISGSNTFTLSRGNGLKTVYFKVKRSSDNVESSPMQTTITMTIASPSIIITSITGTAPNVTVNSSASFAYKMKVVELDEGAIPNWSQVVESDYSAAKAITLTGTGNRVIHVQVINYGDMTASDSEIFTISTSLLNKFNISFGRNNTSQIGETQFYGFSGDVVNNPVTYINIKNSLGDVVGLTGSEVKMGVYTGGTNVSKQSGKTYLENTAFPNFPEAILDARVYKGFSGGSTPLPWILHLRNLNNDHKYTFRFCATHDNLPSPVNIPPIKFEIVGLTTDFDTIDTVAGNLSDEAVIENISPNNGEIMINILTTSTPSYFNLYVSAMVIEQYG